MMVGAPWYKDVGFETNPLGQDSPADVLDKNWYVQTKPAEHAVTNLQSALKSGHATRIFIKGPSGSGKTLLGERLLQVVLAHHDGNRAKLAFERLEVDDDQQSSIADQVTRHRQDLLKATSAIQARMVVAGGSGVIIIENLHKAREEFQVQYLKRCQGPCESAIAHGISIIMMGEQKVFERRDATTISWFDDGAHQLQPFNFEQAKDFLHRRLTLPGQAAGQHLIDDEAVMALADISPIPRELKGRANDLLTRFYRPEGKPLTRVQVDTLRSLATQTQIEQARRVLQRAKGCQRTVLTTVQGIVNTLESSGFPHGISSSMVGAVLDRSWRQPAEENPEAVDKVAREVGEEEHWDLDNHRRDQFVQAFTDLDFAAQGGRCPNTEKRYYDQRVYGLVPGAMAGLREAWRELGGESFRTHLPAILARSVIPRSVDQMTESVNSLLQQRLTACYPPTRKIAQAFLEAKRTEGNLYLAHWTRQLATAAWCQLKKEQPKAIANPVEAVAELITGEPQERLLRAWERWRHLYADIENCTPVATTGWAEGETPLERCLAVWHELAQVIHGAAYVLENADPPQVQEWWSGLSSRLRRLEDLDVPDEAETPPFETQSMLYAARDLLQQTAFSLVEQDASCKRAQLKGFFARIVPALSSLDPFQVDEGLEGWHFLALELLRRDTASGSWRQAVRELDSAVAVQDALSHLILESGPGGPAGASMNSKEVASAYVRDLLKQLQAAAVNPVRDQKDPTETAPEPQRAASGAAVMLCACLHSASPDRREDLCRQIKEWLQADPLPRAFHLLNCLLFAVAWHEWNRKAALADSIGIVEVGEVQGHTDAGSVAYNEEGPAVVIGFQPLPPPAAIPGRLARVKKGFAAQGHPTLYLFDRWATVDDLKEALAGYQPQIDDFSDRRRWHTLLTWQENLWTRTRLLPERGWKILTAIHGKVEAEGRAGLILEAPENLTDGPTIEKWQKATHSCQVLCWPAWNENYHLRGPKDDLHFVAIYWTKTRGGVTAIMDQFRQLLDSKNVKGIPALP